MIFQGLEEYRQYCWQRQLHLFEVPFYYIEYGIAQLGAIGMWQQYKKDPETAINNYITALDLGGTRTLPELFQAAGLEFDFSPGSYQRTNAICKAGTGRNSEKRIKYH